MQEVNADIIGVVEAEDRPSLVRFNTELLGGLYGHVMLIDGNDERGIDVAIMTRAGFDIVSICSNVDRVDAGGTVFSRDCPQFEIRTPGGKHVHVLVNHFKSQSGGGGAKRKRQAVAVRAIADGLVQQGKHVVVLGDLNEGPAAEGTQAQNLLALFDHNSPLKDCYSFAGFDVGSKPGTFDSCGLHNRLDYIFLSTSLQPSFTGGACSGRACGATGRRVRRHGKPTQDHEVGRTGLGSLLVFVDMNVSDMAVTARNPATTGPVARRWRNRPVIHRSVKKSHAFDVIMFTNSPTFACYVRSQLQGVVCEHETCETISSRF
jgi:endonuclease/exonuclease/phosphatase family metal-dependent hydrolase